jgi:hypothetical protein
VLRLLDDQAVGAAAISLAAMIGQLDPISADKSRALNAVLRLLDGQATGKAAVSPQDALAPLDPEPGDVALGLPEGHSGGRNAGGLAGVLIRLGAEPGDKRQAIGALLGRLTRIVGGWEADWEAERVADELIRLDATAEEKHRAFEALLGQLSGRPTLVSAVVQVASIPDDRRQVLRDLLSLLDHEASSDVAGQLINGMAQLDPTVHDLSRSSRWAALPTGQLLAAARRNSSRDEWLERLCSLRPVPNHRPPPAE